RRPVVDDHDLVVGAVDPPLVGRQQRPQRAGQLPRHVVGDDDDAQPAHGTPSTPAISTADGGTAALGRPPAPGRPRPPPPHLAPRTTLRLVSTDVSEFLRSYLTVGVFFGVAVALLAGILSLGKALRPDRPQPEKYIAYESGVDPV